jgi:hypothetical protein
VTGTSTGRPGLRNPLTWSFLAVVISIVALVISVISLHSGDGTVTATGKTVGAEPVSATTTQPDVPSTDVATTDADTETPTDDASGPVSTVLPSAGASYTISHSNVHIRLPGGDSYRYLDLDEPLVNSNSEQTDVVYHPGMAKLTLDFNSANVAVAKSADVTPDECSQAIQLSPSDQGIEVSQDLVICAETNGIGAVNEPSRAKMARIIVNSVSKGNNIDLTVTTWEIPH